MASRYLSVKLSFRGWLNVVICFSLTSLNSNWTSQILCPCKDKSKVSLTVSLQTAWSRLQSQHRLQSAPTTLQIRHTPHYHMAPTAHLSILLLQQVTPISRDLPWRKAQFRPLATACMPERSTPQRGKTTPIWLLNFRSWSSRRERLVSEAPMNKLAHLCREERQVLTMLHLVNQVFPRTSSCLKVRLSVSRYFDFEHC